MRYSFADCHWPDFSCCLHCATLHCLVAYATVLIDLSMVSIVAVDRPLPIPNREVKPDNADDTTNVGKLVDANLCELGRLSSLCLPSAVFGI